MANHLFKKSENFGADSLKRNARLVHDLANSMDFDAKKYLKRTAININLNSLYTVLSSTNFTTFDKFTGVLLK